MSTQIDGLGLYNNPYGLYNSYSTGAMNDDFMAQQIFQNNGQNAAQPSNQTSFQGYQQPQADTFEKSGSGFSTGLKLGLVGGAGTTAGMYFFGTNPVNDGKFNDNILKAVDINVDQAAKTRAAEIFANKKAEILQKAGIPEYVNSENLKTYAKTGAGSQELKNAMNQQQAQAVYEELEKIDIEKIGKDAYTETFEKTLEGRKDKLANLQTQRAKLEALADDADLEKFFKDNANTFGISGDEKTIDAEAKKLAAKYKNKAGAISDYTTQITNQETLVKSTREALNTKVAAYYDDAAKSLKASAPENIQKAFKNFKLKTAGKWGAIAAGAGLILGCLFSGNK